MTETKPFYWHYFLFSLLFFVLTGCPSSESSGPQGAGESGQTDVKAVNAKQLKLDNTEITDADLKEICEKNPDLVELTLGGTKIQNLDESLAQLTKLKKIRVSNAEISTKALEVLAKIESLEDIDLSQTPIGVGNDLALLAGLPNLKRLNLYSTSISNRSLDALKEFKSAEKIVWLNIDKCLLTDGAISKLTPLKNLEWLHLGRTGLTDPGLEELAKLASLKEVSITNTNVTKEGVEKLKAALPGCKINENVDAPGE